MMTAIAIKMKWFSFFTFKVSSIGICLGAERAQALLSDVQRPITSLNHNMLSLNDVIVNEWAVGPKKGARCR